MFKIKLSIEHNKPKNISWRKWIYYYFREMFVFAHKQIVNLHFFGCSICILLIIQHLLWNINELFEPDQIFALVCLVFLPMIVYQNECRKIDSMDGK